MAFPKFLVHFRCLEHAVDNFNQRGFSGPVLAEQGMHFAGVDAEVDVVVGGVLVVVEVDVGWTSVLVVVKIGVDTGWNIVLAVVMEVGMGWTSVLVAAKIGVDTG